MNKRDDRPVHLFNMEKAKVAVSSSKWLNLALTVSNLIKLVQNSDSLLHQKESLSEAQIGVDLEGYSNTRTPFNFKPLFLNT